MPRKKSTPKAKAIKPVSQDQSQYQAEAKKRRYQAHLSVLRELRKIEKHMQPAIPRLPFQRVVRQICTDNNIKFKWKPSALLCLQEAMEDWLVEFFEDAYFLAAHAHRLTIMPKDFNTLRLIRYKHEGLLKPVLEGDKRMADILTIPPLHPRQAAQMRSSVRHGRNTRSQAEGTDRVDAPLVTEIPVEDNPEILVEEIPDAVNRERAVAEQDLLNSAMTEEYDNFLQVAAAVNLGTRREICVLQREDINVFRNPQDMMTDSSLRFVAW